MGFRSTHQLPTGRNAKPNSVKAKQILVDYRGLLCVAIRERNEHFFEGLGKLTYIEHLINCLDQCPDELYADKKAARKIGEIERRIDSWD